MFYTTKDIVLEFFRGDFFMEIKTYNIDSSNIHLPKDSFIFDLETLGLSRQYHEIILVGAMFWNEDKLILKQYFAHTRDEEILILESFLADISAFKKAITFNGNSFDLPFLKSRLTHHKLKNLSDEVESFDLLARLKPLKNMMNLDSLKLKNIEKYFGIYREDGISGKESVDLYKEFEISFSDSLKDIILLHNKEDVHYLGILTGKYNEFLDKLSINLNISGEHILARFLSCKFTSKLLTLSFSVETPLSHEVEFFGEGFFLYANTDSLKFEFPLCNIKDNDLTSTFWIYNESLILKCQKEIFYNNIFFILKNSIERSDLN